MKGMRIIIVLVVVVIGAAVAYYGLSSKHSSQPGAEGTIGAANRYQAGQISDQDVTLKNPEVQAFLQSDLFHKLATNADFRTCVQNEAFGRVAQFIASRSTDAGRQVMGDAAKQVADGAHAMADNAKQVSDNAKQVADGAHAMADNAKQVSDNAHQMADNAISRVVDALHVCTDNATVRQMPDNQRQVLFSDQFAHLMQDGAYRSMVSDAAFQQAAARQKFDGLTGKVADNWAKFANAPDQLALMKSPDWAKMVSSDGFKNLMGDFARAPRTDAGRVIGLVSSDNFKNLAGADFAKLVSDGAVAKLVTADSFRSLMDNRSFMDALSNRGFDQLLLHNADLAKVVTE